MITKIEFNALIQALDNIPNNLTSFDQLLSNLVNDNSSQIVSKSNSLYCFAENQNSSQKLLIAYDANVGWQNVSIVDYTSQSVDIFKSLNDSLSTTENITNNVNQLFSQQRLKQLGSEAVLRAIQGIIKTDYPRFYNCLQTVNIVVNDDFSTLAVHYNTDINKLELVYSPSAVELIALMMFCTNYTRASNRSVRYESFIDFMDIAVTFLFMHEMYHLLFRHITDDTSKVSDEFDDSGYENIVADSYINMRLIKILSDHPLMKRSLQSMGLKSLSIDYGIQDKLTSAHTINPKLTKASTVSDINSYITNGLSLSDIRKFNPSDDSYASLLKFGQNSQENDIIKLMMQIAPSSVNFTYRNFSDPIKIIIKIMTDVNKKIDDSDSLLNQLLDQLSKVLPTINNQSQQSGPSQSNNQSNQQGNTQQSGSDQGQSGQQGNQSSSDQSDQNNPQGQSGQQNPQSDQQFGQSDSQVQSDQGQDDQNQDFQGQGQSGQQNPQSDQTTQSSQGGNSNQQNQSGQQSGSGQDDQNPSSSGSQNSSPDQLGQISPSTRKNLDKLPDELLDNLDKIFKDATTEAVSQLDKVTNNMATHDESVLKSLGKIESSGSVNTHSWRIALKRMIEQATGITIKYLADAPNARIEGQFGRESIETELGDLILSFDCSGSMSPNDFIAAILHIQELNKLGIKFKRIGLVYWSDSYHTPRSVRPRRMISSQLIQLVKNYYPGSMGGTDFDAIFEPFTKGELKAIKPDLIIVFTDGIITASTDSPEYRWYRKYRKKTLFVLNVGSERGVTRLKSIDPTIDKRIVVMKDNKHSS